MHRTCTHRRVLRASIQGKEHKRRTLWWRGKGAAFPPPAVAPLSKQRVRVEKDRTKRMQATLRTGRVPVTCPTISCVCCSASARGDEEDGGDVGVRSEALSELAVGQGFGKPVLRRGVGEASHAGGRGVGGVDGAEEAVGPVAVDAEEPGGSAARGAAGEVASERGLDEASAGVLGDDVSGPEAPGWLGRLGDIPKDACLYLCAVGKRDEVGLHTGRLARYRQDVGLRAVGGRDEAGLGGYKEYITHYLSGVEGGNPR